MSAATGSTRVGRPGGTDPETLAKGREFLMLAGYGVSADAMAQRSGLSRSFVYYALGLARAEASSRNGGDAHGASAAPVEAAPPPRPRKLSEGRVLSRTYDAIRNVRAFKGLLDAETREFWVEALIEIRALADDGINLTFGGQGDIYTSQAEFLSVFGLPATRLEKLFRHAMLVDLDGAGVAMPYRWGLRGKQATTRQAVRPVTERPLPFPFQVVKGGPPESEETSISSDSMSKEMAIYSDSNSEETPISSDSAGVARIAAAAAKNQSYQSTGSSSSLFPGRACESEEITGESEETPGESEEIKLQRSPAGELAADLAARAMLGRPATPGEIGQVQHWSDAGVAPGLLRSVVDGVMQRRKGEPPASLMYFDRAISEARRKSAEPAAVPPSQSPSPAPAAAPSADTALRKALDARWDRWDKGHKYGPVPPVFLAFKAACDGGAMEAAANRWLLAYDAWWEDGRPSDGCPPVFSDYMRDPAAMEARMLACEDVLSRPDDPDVSLGNVGDG